MFFEDGLDRIWREHKDIQLEYIKAIIKDIRGITDDNLFNQMVNYCVDRKLFYVDNPAYLENMFGKEILNVSEGIFTPTLYTYLDKRLAIPMFNMNGGISGFIGYSNYDDNLPEDAPQLKYIYPSSQVFSKAKYMYITREEFKKSIEDDYICIVEGFFDKAFLSCLGINAVALCGSSLTFWHTLYLQFIKHKIVVSDNDLAGRKLYNACKFNLTNVVEIKQHNNGDIHDYLRNPNQAEKFLETFNQMQQEGFLLSKEIR